MAQRKTTRFTLDLDPVLQSRLKVMAARKGMSMRQYCLQALEREMQQEEKEPVPVLPFGAESIARLNALRDRVFQGRTVAVDSVDLLREAREDRDRQIDGWLGDK